MLIAQYRGTSPASKVIRFITRSPYSHSAFLFDESTEAAAIKLVRERYPMGGLTHVSSGSVVEAWQDGVRSTPNISFGHEPATQVDIFRLVKPLSLTEEADLIKLIIPEIGVPYGFRNVARFLTKRPGNLDDTWFCSELVVELLLKIGRVLLARTKSWEAPPDWLPRSIAIELIRTQLTNFSFSK